ncbi:hypothetical protein [Vibrio sp. WXL103]|uniref:hypothetical protein n=1 Tax=unclassified Vibrio TaxID=2614977 RepID=UPI003EC5FF3F
MKHFVLILLLASPFASVASSGTGGVPTVPCYVDGEYKGSVEITKCTSHRGKTSQS